MTKVIDEFRGEYGFLSNFHQHPFEYKGLTYPNSEAAFQAQKCATEEACTTFLPSHFLQSIQKI